MLRCGLTTGTCAALAAKAAAKMLLGGRIVRSEELFVPAGLRVRADIETPCIGGDSARCAVRKDAGDDPDVTDGALIVAEVRRCASGMVIDGGNGVGRITRAGLEQPVGAAAINSVPRRMIAQAVAAVCEVYGYAGGMAVTISVPEGETLAEKTYNPRLGIEGGISILGTSGIVEPNSLQALVDTIGVELRMLSEQGHRRLILTPGNYGEAFLAKHPPGGDLPIVKCSNFIGDALDLAAGFSFSSVFLVGHIGKLCKLAAGIMNTHSRFADGRVEVFASHAALAGGDVTLIGALMSAVTADECIALLDEVSLREPVMRSILERSLRHICRRVNGAYETGLLLFSDRCGVLAATENAQRLLLGGN